MIRLKRASIVSAAAILAAIVAAVLSARADRGGPLMLAYPQAMAESAVMTALRAAGIEGALGATTTPVPLSDFSRVVSTPFLEADARAAGGDPRRTPLLDELARRFLVTGPDGDPWRVIYLADASSATGDVLSEALAGLACPWASSAYQERGAPRFLWIPPFLWACWLVARKPRRDRLGRAVLALAWLPLLYGATLGSAILFVALEAATMAAYPLARAGLSRLLPRALWPFAVLVAAMAAVEPGSAPRLAAAIVSLGALAYLRPRLERLAGRGRLHEPPSFKALTTIGATRNSGRLALAMAVPIAVILAGSALAPARASDGPSASAYGLDRDLGASLDARGLLKDHMAFQEAITYGRIGDAVWGAKDYAPAYRYTEDSGRMARSADPVDSEPDEPLEAYKGALTVLSGPAPRSIRLLSHKTSPSDESALP